MSRFSSVFHLLLGPDFPQSLREDFSRGTAAPSPRTLTVVAGPRTASTGRRWPATRQVRNCEEAFRTFYEHSLEVTYVL